MRERHPVLERLYYRPYETDAQTEALQTLYRETCPTILEPSRAPRKHAKFIVSALAKLADHAESFTQMLRRDVSVEADGELYSVDLSPITEAYERAADDSRYVLALLRRPYAREVDLVTQCVCLFIRLTDSVRATDREAVGLLKIALRAHGYEEKDLKQFAPRTGTIRKHAHTVTEAFRKELTDQLNRKGKYSRAVLQPVPMKVLLPDKQ
jgi:hypothetical protein